MPSWGSCQGGFVKRTFLEMKVGLASSVVARRFTMSLKDRRDARACYRAQGGQEVLHPAIV